MDLLLIANKPEHISRAIGAGVDRIMVDLEIHGKQERQGHLDTVISGHSVADIAIAREIVAESELMVRVNPIGDTSESEIAACIDGGVDRIMLPMFTSVREVETFMELVDGRAATTLLLETPAALTRIKEILNVPQVEEVHIGLNDLHLGLGLEFMFEPLTSGLVEYCATTVLERGMKFGFGGIARMGHGLIPGDLVLSEHARLGSTLVIVSRDLTALLDSPAGEFESEIADLRAHWKVVSSSATAELDATRRKVNAAIRSIVLERQRSRIEPRSDAGG